MRFAFSPRSEAFGLMDSSFSQGSIPPLTTIPADIKSDLLKTIQISIQFFFLIKSSKMDFIFSPAFYLIMWLMTSAKNFEKIAILNLG